MAKKSKKVAKTKISKSYEETILEVIKNYFGTVSDTAERKSEVIQIFKETMDRKHKFADENKEHWKKQRDELFKKSPSFIRPEKRISRDLNEEKLNKTFASISDIFSNDKLSKHEKINNIFKVIKLYENLCEETKLENL